MKQKVKKQHTELQELFRGPTVSPYKRHVVLVLVRTLVGKTDYFKYYKHFENKRYMKCKIIKEYFQYVSENTYNSPTVIYASLTQLMTNSAMETSRILVQLKRD